MLENLVAAAQLVFTWQALVLAVLGVFLGEVLGAIPGIGGIIAIAILIPITYYLPPAAGIIMLIAISKGAIFAGSIPAILIRAPGTPAAACTVIDGYELAKQGKAKKAMKMALYASITGDTFSDIVLILVALPISKIALKFGPAEYSTLLLFSLVVLSLVANSLPAMTKGLVITGLGLFLATVGVDPMFGTVRLTFGIVQLERGISFIPMLIGLFAMSEVFKGAAQTKSTVAFKEETFLPSPKSPQDSYVTRAEMKSCLRTIFKSSAIGTFIGALPGIGAETAVFASYNEAMRSSKHPETFGRGELEGVAAPEAANNATCGANLIPLLTLGIPGSLTAAVLLGAFLLHGLAPGPLLFKENIVVVYAIYIGIIVCNFINLGVGRMFIEAFSWVSRVRKIVLIPVIFIFCVAGSYAINTSLFDVGLMIGFGLFGYYAGKFDFPMAPFLISFILGRMVEENVRQALWLSEGSVAIFFTRPIALIFLILTIVVAVLSVRRVLKIQKLLEAYGERP